MGAFVSFHQPVCNVTALTFCRLRRGWEHLSAFTDRSAYCGTYFLLFEEGMVAFVSFQSAVYILRHLPPVGWRGRQHS